MEKKATRAHWSQLNVISSLRYGAGKTEKVFRSKEKERESADQQKIQEIRENLQNM